MSLGTLFQSLTRVLDPSSSIEAAALSALNERATEAENSTFAQATLQEPFQDVLNADSAFPVCSLICSTPLPWAIPETSSDPRYRADSVKKMLVELIGPTGILKSDSLRMGLYGILPGAQYGFRTHPAEEVFIMLAGEADWAKGDEGFETLRTGDRAYHPSMVRHATRTTQSAFMSLYIWRGDVSFDQYTYDGGLPS